MVNFILIAICIAAGWLIRRGRILTKDAAQSTNIWILYVAMPATAFKYLPQLKWSHDLVIPAVMPLIVWAGAWLMIKAFRNSFDKPTAAALTITGGLGNTSFLGFPLVAAYFGENALSVAVICDQVTFILLSSVAVVMAVLASKKSGISLLQVVKRIIAFPPFISFIAALTLPKFIDISFLAPLFDKLASTLAPLALFSVGIQLDFENWAREIKPLGIGLVYKLLLAPTLILLLVIAFRLKGLPAQIAIFEAAMAPMITAGILADQHELNPPVSNLMVGLGILISLVTTAVWWWIIRALVF